MSRLIAALLASTSAAFPAFAQDNCGLDGGDWIGGTSEGSDISAAESYLEQMALVLSANAHVSLFSVSALSDVRIEAAGRGNGDPAIQVYDASGALIAEDDDSGGFGASRLELALDEGSYCISTVSYDGSPMSAFVRVGLIGQEPLTEGIDDSATGAGEEAGNTVACAEAPQIGVLDGTISATGSASQSRMWQFNLPEDTAISITAENEAADPTILLTNIAGDYIAENDDFDGLNSRIDVTSPLPAGDYCLEVDALSDAEEQISLTVDVYDAQAALAVLYDRGEAAPPLDGSVAFTDLGDLQSRLRSDVPIAPEASWLRFSVPESGLVLIEALGTGAGSDPWIALYDDLGRQIGLNDDFGGGLDSQITARVNPGDYLLAVKQVGEGGGFVRLLAERYVPAQ